MVEAIDRLDVHAPHLFLLQHVEPNRGAGRPLRPDLAVKIAQTCRLLAVDADDHVTAPHSRPVGRPPGVTRLTNRRPRNSSVLMPSQGRPGPAMRPSAIRSPRMGASRSIGTNMLPGVLSLPPLASGTMSEPTPTSLPSRLISAAPLQAGCGGAVNKASSSMYSQLPANSRFATT